MDKNVQTKWLNMPVSLLRPIRFAVPPVVGLQDMSPNSRRLTVAGPENRTKVRLSQQSRSYQEQNSVT
jgi:hypothetical protein